MVARAFGSGTISFGLVSIPVKLYTTQKPGSDISFNLLHDRCGTKLKQQYICPKDNEIVPRENTVKGYEHSKGQYVMLTEDEIRALEAVGDSTLAISEFVPADAIDPLYIEKSYYVGADKGGDRAYALLGRAMRETGLVGVARYAARGKQYVVMIRPFGEHGLIMHQLRYHDEVRAFEEVPLADAPALSHAELDLATQFVERLAHSEFQPESYTDEVKERVLGLIRQKLAGQDIAAPAEQPKGEIIDLMEALKASLGMAPSSVGAAPGSQRKPAKAAPRPTAPARTTASRSASTGTTASPASKARK